MAEVLLNQEQIKEIIPHRAPFLLIDEVLSMEVGKKVVARKYIKEDDFWFKGHFPEKPVTPGVLMIEMLAQAGAVCILSQPEFKSLCLPESTRQSSASRLYRAMFWTWKWKSSAREVQSVSARQLPALPAKKRLPAKSNSQSKCKGVAVCDLIQY